MSARNEKVSDVMRDIFCNLVKSYGASLYKHMESNK